MTSCTDWRVERLPHPTNAQVFPCGHRYHNHYEPGEKYPCTPDYVDWAVRYSRRCPIPCLFPGCGRTLMKK